jgi:hypothetical protein
MQEQLCIVPWRLADLDKCPKCGYDWYKRKIDGEDDNNVDNKNEPD